MRNNHPVSTREYPFPAGSSLVSVTDPKGRITYCNEAFVQVSGFEKHELLGQPHNIVRHPDMPEEAFRDMWATISAGHPWSAPVKNRRKNGDYYWVMANAVPLMERGSIVGYMSVRTEATRAQVQAAEALYATMRDEQREGRQTTTLRRGTVRRNTLLGRGLELVTQAKLSTKLLFASFAHIALGGAASVYLTELHLEWAAALVVLGLIVSAWQFKVRLVVHPLEGLIRSAHTLAGGDLTAKVRRTRTDEIGDLQGALGQVSVNLQSIVRDALAQSGRLVVNSAEISDGNENLSQRTLAQAGNIEETASTLAAVTDTVRSSAESAAGAGVLAREVLAAAEQSNLVVTEVRETMHGIHDFSRRISDITSVIDSMAFQTNLLALNAAVEAARAGEHGRGFAVVAAEIRALSQRSAGAAKEIKRLLDESSAQVDLGLVRADKAATAMDAAVVGVRKVSDYVDEISHGAREQLNSISEINSAIGELDVITQQNAALVEQGTAASMALQDLAAEAHATMQVFRLDGVPTRKVDAVELRRNAAPAVNQNWRF